MALTQLVLLTGGSGHVGFRVLVETLKAGYSVRAAIRSPASADQILSAPSIRSLQPGSKLDFVIVPDITVSGAYDKAVSGVDYVIHIASSIPQGYLRQDFQAKIIHPAVKGTLGILRSAAQSGTVKRVVITSSAVAIWPLKGWMAGDFKDALREDREVAIEPGPFETEVEAYCASKAQALGAAHDFVRQERPSFDVVNLMPSYVFGRNDLASQPNQVSNGTNGMILRLVLGSQNQMPQGGASVHIDDVAEAHIQALSSNIEGNQDYLLSSGGTDGIIFQDAINVVERDYKEALENGTLSNKGSQPTMSLKIDASKAQRAFGLRFQSYESQVKSVVDHYLQLVKNSRL